MREAARSRKNKAINFSSGQSMVETALMLPIVILFLVAIIDFGLLFNNYIVLINASREGARTGVTGSSNTAILEAVDRASETLNAARKLVTITPSPGLRASGSQLSVSIRYENRLITPIIGALFANGTAVLNARTVMRIE